MLDLRRLQTLQAVVDSGSFAGAAALLGYTQSAVSQHLAELEAAAGARLVERRPVRVTPAGEVALRGARTAETALAAARDELHALREGYSGTVRLGSFASAASTVAAPAIGRLARSRPDVRVALAQREPAEAYEGLLRGELDLALTFAREHGTAAPPAGVTEMTLDDDPFLAALPEGHRLARRRTVDLADLAAERWVGAPGAGVPLAALPTLARVPGFTAGTLFDGDDFRVVLSLVAAGAGVALLPRLALSHAPEGVVTRPLRGTPLVRHVRLALAADRTPSAAADALADELRSALWGVATLDQQSRVLVTTQSGHRFVDRAVTTLRGATLDHCSRVGFALPIIASPCCAARPRCR